MSIEQRVATTKKNRIEYIDALRGYVMLLVVLGHIPMYCYHASGTLSFSQLPSLFHLALFFFISGWFFGNGKREKPWIMFVTEKFTQLIIPTAIFYSLYCFIHDVDVVDNLWYDKYKAGYWFCIVLFCFFIISKLLKNHNGGVISSLIIVCIGLSLNTNTITRLLMDWNIPNVLCIQQWQYYIFFYMGNIARKHEKIFFSWLDNGKIMGVSIALFFVTLILFYQQPVNLLGIKIEFLFWGSIGTILSFAFFRKYASAFSQETRIGKGLQYIGSRTLDVYLLHFFFLPNNMEWLGTHIMGNGNQVIELFVSLTIALMVTSFCLLISNIIRLSPPLAHIVLRAKKV